MTPLPATALPAITVTAVALAQSLCLAGFVIAQILLVLYASHRYLVLWRWRRRRDAPVTLSGRDAPRADWPRVTLQLPLYNERRVARRSILAAARLDYPADRLEIQVLDDSTDDTRRVAARCVSRLRSRGIDVTHLHRGHRRGFKAGALQAGLACARGELVAVFDADFLPPRDFLRSIVPHFDDPRTGMVQARWGHLNRRRSLVTASQAVMLDAHFQLEHRTREAEGLFFNFNGTAGVWRRACIEDAGGWSDDTLTEDLDLSYRAQLRGWRFRFASDVVAPAELPADVMALRSQQHRWAKGSIQVARKLLPRLLRGPGSMRLRLEAFVHLTSNVAYPLVLALGLLLWPVLLAAPSPDPRWIWAAQIAVWCFGVAPTVLFLSLGQRLSGVGWLRAARDVGGALLLGIGLSLNNTRAVLEGMRGPAGHWERTPKTGDRGGAFPGPAPDPPAPDRAIGLESALTVYFAALSGFAWQAGHHRALPFTLMLLCGFGWVAWSGRRRLHIAAAVAPKAAGSPEPTRAIV